MLDTLVGAFTGSPELLALFVGFGLVVGILFGFFGMGGSFLVTPALLMMGYPARVAVGRLDGRPVVGPASVRHRRRFLAA